MKTEKAFKHAPLDQYSFKQRLLIRAADLGFYSMIKLIGATVKFEIEGQHYFDEIAARGQQPIYAFWHDRIFLGTYYFRDRGIVVITSQSFDGEYIARFIQRLGYGSARGSSTRGGIGALVDMIKLMKKGLPAGFTVDGPKGPRYEAKPGPVMLAKKTGNPIVPFIVEAKGFWTVKSWDRLQIPKPFTKAKIIVGEPIYVEPDSDEAAAKIKLAKLQQTLDELVVSGQQWHNSTT